MINDLRFACRQLLKNPGFTAVAVATLALGIGANTVMFSLIHGVLLKPLPYPEPYRLVSLFEHNKAQSQDFIPLNAPGFMDWRAQNSVFEDMAVYQGRGFDLTGASEAQRVFGVRVSTSLFPMLHVNPVLGRIFTVEEEVFGKGRVVVIDHRLWQERFGGGNSVLGEKLILDGNTFSIIGVMPPGFRFANIVADLWVPIAFESFELENRGGHNYQCVARLKPGVSLAKAQTEMNTIAARLGQNFQDAKGWEVTMLPLQEQQVGGSRRPLLVMFGAVGFVLLIACANVANLLLARAAVREREFAVLGALGASRARIVRQLIIESLILSSGAASVGWLMSHWALDAVVKLQAFPRLENVRLDGWVLGFTVFTALLTGLVFGLAPAWLASRTRPGEILKDAARGSTPGRRQGLRDSFVTVQVGFALVLLIGASLMLRSFARLQAVDLGYQPHRILTAALSMPDTRFLNGEAQRKAFLARVVQRLEEMPGVDSSASVMGLPLAFGGARSLVYVDGRPEPKPNEPQVSGYSQISTNYFQTMDTALLRGRHFDGHDTVDAPFVAIVNESFVHMFFPHEDPLGKRLKVFDSRRDQPTEIVGVVRDSRQRDIAAPPGPEMYFPVMQRCWSDVQIVVRTRIDPVAMISTLRRAVSEVDPLQTIYLIRPMETLLEDALLNRWLQMLLLGAFSGIALLLAAVGI